MATGYTASLAADIAEQWQVIMRRVLPNWRTMLIGSALVIGPVMVVVLMSLLGIR
jgi:hypothetical protein